MIFWILNFILFQFNWQLTQQHLHYSHTKFSQKEPDLAGKMTGSWSTGFSRKIMTSSGPAFGQSGLAAPTGFSHIRLTTLEKRKLLTKIMIFVNFFLFSCVITPPIYEKCRPRHDGKTLIWSNISQKRFYIDFPSFFKNYPTKKFLISRSKNQLWWKKTWRTD